MLQFTNEFLPFLLCQNFQNIVVTWFGKVAPLKAFLCYPAFNLRNRLL
jgi:hypothetical protein